MQSKKIRSVSSKMTPLKPWHFVVLFVIFSVVGAFALRSNNLHMVELREAVYAADKNNGDTETALQNLRSYVIQHMNTGLSSGDNTVYPPIQLKYTYQRLVTAASQAAADSNSSVYSTAQAYCEKQIPDGFSGRYRLGCIEQYVEEHSSVKVTNIPDSLYKFDFVSPRWSPDLAGWSLVAAFLSLVGLVSSLLVRRVHQSSKRQ